MPSYNKYELYEASVQDSEGEAELFEQIYREAHRRKPRTLREDFCATFLHCCEWVKRHPQNRAIGVDIDRRPLNYGTKHHLSQLTPNQRKRITLLQQDVMEIRKPKADMITVSNFSIFFLKNRKDLVNYFRRCRQALGEKGILAFDLLGGMEIGDKNTERRKFKMPDKTPVTYIWEQTSFNPVTHEGLFYIHYEFKNGRKMKKSFCYDWRIWSIPEMRDALAEAGFGRSYVYWEGDDKKGGGNGYFDRANDAENCDIWIAYVAGVKG